MKINGVDISLYKAIQLNDDIQVCKSENASEWSKNHINPIFDDNKFTFKNINITLLIEGRSKEEVKDNISNIVNLLRKKSLIELDHYKNNFIGIYDSCTINKKSAFVKEIILDLKGYEEKRIETESVISDSNEHIIICNGTTVSPCYLEVLPKYSCSEITLAGLSDDPIKIKNLTANVPIIIGYNNKITQNGINKFEDVELYEFPRVVPGSNAVKLSNDKVTLTIKYKERFI